MIIEEINISLLLFTMFMQILSIFQTQEYQFLKHHHDREQKLWLWIFFIDFIFCDDKKKKSKSFTQSRDTYKIKFKSFLKFSAV